MQFTVNKKLLAQVVSFASRMTNGKSTLPILAYIGFRTVNDSLVEVTATNLTQFIRLQMYANVQEFGSVALLGSMLSELLATLPDEQVSVRSSDRTFVTEIKCARHKSNLKGSDAFDMPAIPELGELPTVEVAPSVLTDMLDGVVKCASDDGSRQGLATVKMVQIDGILQTVATDGHRLGLTSFPVATYPIDALIPAQSIGTLTKLLPQAGTVKLATSTSHAIFALDCMGDITEIVFASTLVDSRYPDYNTIIPKSHDVDVQVEVVALEKALNLAKLFTDDNKKVSLDFLPETGVRVSVAGNDGDYLALVPATVNLELRLAVSFEYMLEALGTCPTEMISITGTKEKRPLGLHPVGDCPNAWYQMVMPMSQ